MKRDILLHGRVTFVELSRMYVRADGPIGQTSGVAKDLEELIRVTETDVTKPVRAEDEVFDRLTAFLYALEYLYVMPFDQDGAMLYLKELTRFRGKNLVWNTWLRYTASSAMRYRAPSERKTPRTGVMSSSRS